MSVEIRQQSTGDFRRHVRDVLVDKGLSITQCFFNQCYFNTMMETEVCQELIKGHGVCFVVHPLETKQHEIAQLGESASQNLQTWC